MDMDDFLKSDEQRKESKAVSNRELLEKLKAQTKEETHKRFDKFIKEVAAIIDFTQTRISEVTEEYEELSVLGGFGFVMSAVLTGKPVAYGALGSAKSIGDAMKFAMLRTMANEFEEGSADESEGEED